MTESSNLSTYLKENFDTDSPSSSVKVKDVVVPFFKQMTGNDLPYLETAAYLKKIEPVFKEMQRSPGAFTMETQLLSVSPKSVPPTTLSKRKYSKEWRKAVSERMKKWHAEKRAAKSAGKKRKFSDEQRAAASKRMKKWHADRRAAKEAATSKQNKDSKKHKDFEAASTLSELSTAETVPVESQDYTCCKIISHMTRTIQIRGQVVKRLYYKVFWEGGAEPVMEHKNNMADFPAEVAKYWESKFE